MTVERSQSVVFNWVLALIATLLLLPPVATHAQSCENPQTLERESIVHISFQYDAVMLKSGAYAFDNETLFGDKEGNPVGADYFRPGMLVTAEVCLPEANAEVSANQNFPIRGYLKSLRELAPPELLEITGAITEIDDQQGGIVVDGKTILVINETVIRDAEGGMIGFADLAVGDEVKVVATPRQLDDSTVAPSLVALAIKVLGGEPTIIVVEGPITAFGPTIALYQGWIRVDGKQFIITSEAEILDEDGNPISVADLHLGDVVRVSATRGAEKPNNPELALFAFKVERLQVAPPPSSLKGHIAEINSETRCFVVVTANVNDSASIPERHLVCTTNATTYSTTEGQELSFADLEVGMHVEVILDPDVDVATLIARQVIVSPGVPPPPPPSVKGYITMINAEERCFQIAPFTTAAGEVELPPLMPVCTNNETVFRTLDGDALEFGDFKAGDLIEAVPDERILAPMFVAREVILLDGEVGPVVVEGPIQRIFHSPSIQESKQNEPLPPNALIVDETVFVVNNETKIADADGNEIAFAALRVGDIVRVEGTRVLPVKNTIAPPLVALSITLIEPAEPPTKIEGHIATMDPATGCFGIAPGSANIDVSILPPVTQVCTDSTTILRTINGTPLTFEDFQVGDRVLVILAESPERQDLIAKEVILLRPPSEPIVVEGVITAIEPAPADSPVPALGIVVVDELPFLVSGETALKAPNGERIDFEDLEVGMRVRAVGLPGPLDALVPAIEIHVLRNGEPEPITLTGRIQAINPATTATGLVMIVVREKAFMVNTETRIVNEEGEPLAVENLAVGMLVSVKAIRPTAADTIPVAVYIKVLDEHEPGPIRFAGLVESIDVDSQQLVVRGILVQVVEETEILGLDGLPVGLDSLAEGDFVHVEGLRDSSNTAVTAMLIKLHEDPHHNGEVEFRGMISEIDPAQGSMIVGGRLVLANESTVILDIENNLIGIDGLRIGMLVEVEGQVLPSLVAPSPIEATKIEIERVGGCLEVQIEGLLDGKEEGVWTVAGKRFQVTGETRFASRNGESLGPDDFQPGDYLRMNGCARPDAIPVARVVIKYPELDNPPACVPEIFFSGAVESVDPAGGMLVIDGRNVKVEDYTILFREEAGPISLDDINVDDIARVGATGEPNAVDVTACFIHIKSDVEPPPPQDHRVVGKIDAVDPEAKTLIVRERLIQVSDETKILTRRGETIAFQDLAVGMLIDARGRLDADNVLVAIVIRVQEENQNPRPLRPLFGRITELNLPDSLSIGEIVVQLTNETEFAGLLGEAIDPSILLVGDAVVALPDPDASDPAAEPRVFVAKKVKLRAAVIEEIDTANTLIVVAGGPVSVTENTEIIERPGGTPLTFEDLVVGDLVRVELSPLAIFPPQAVKIVRIAVPEFSDRIDEMQETIADIDNGRPTLTNQDPSNTFGFVSMPIDMAGAEANTLYEVHMRISTNVTNPYEVPAARVRVNMANYEKGATLVINSANSFSHVPTPEGRDYSLLFVPPAELAVSDEGEATFFASLDLLSFEPRFSPDATLRLDAVSVQPVALSKIQVVETLLRDEFVIGTSGWTFGTGGDFTPPRYGAETGNLVLVSADAFSFGFWTKDTGIKAEAGKTYRARFMVRTDISDPTKVPTFRLRLNTSSFELGTTVNIDAAADALETLRTDSRVYDIYLVVPENATGLDTILASIDLLSFDGTKDLDAAVNLEQFLLEEVEIAE